MKKIIKGFVIALVLSLGCMIFVLSHSVGGWRAFIVTSGSMEPAIRTGSLALTIYTYPHTLRKNDIITFIAPTKERTMVTHRIVSIVQKENLTVIKTKGDNNKNMDSWTLAGGGVVGKVSYSIPFLGYFFSFTQTKTGVLALILLPSLYILYSELEVLYKLFRKEFRGQKASQAHTAILLLLLVSLFSINHSAALLSDSVALAGNQFTFVKQPSSSPDCGSNVTATISNNGSGSTNNINISRNCSENIHQSTTTNSTTIIDADANTGGNTVSNNSGSTSVVTGSSSNVIFTQTNQANH